MSKKSRTFSKVFDGIKSWNISSTSNLPTPKPQVEIEEKLKCEDFQFGKIVRHGFPYEPSCLAFDPVQRLLAIGTKYGSIRVLGRAGVDFHLKQPLTAAVLQLIFVTNEGYLLAICNDDSIHKWNIRQKQPSIVNSLNFKKERLTCGVLPHGSKWLYVGTEGGNVHFVQMQNFTISGYVINWNKSIDLSMSVRPGSVVQIAENPQDSSKILIGFSSGFLVLWDLKNKMGESRFKLNETLYSFWWNQDGKQFISSHSNGCLATWNCRHPNKPVSVIHPHARENSAELYEGSYESICHLDWIQSRNGESCIVFSGGSPLSNTSSTQSTQITPPKPSITVMRGKKLSVIQMDSAVVDFVHISDSPFRNENTQADAVAILLERDLVLIDLQSPNYPSFANPYAMDIHDSPVTSCCFIGNGPDDLVPALYSVRGRQNTMSLSSPSSNTSNTEQNTSGGNGQVISSRDWPITGGQWGSAGSSSSEVIITGHEDGSIRFWDASSMGMMSLYKLRLSKCFDLSSKNDSQTAINESLDASHFQQLNQSDPSFNSGASQDVSSSLAIHHIRMCLESRKLLVAGSYFSILLHFGRKEFYADMPVVDVSMEYDTKDDSGIVTKEKIIERDLRSSCGLPHQSGSLGSYPHSQATAERQKQRRFIPAVRSGCRKWPPGYRPELLCRLTVSNNSTTTSPSVITSIALCSTYALIALGNENGVSIVDYIQKTCLMSTSTRDLYGPLELPNRTALRSPTSKKEDQKTSPVDASSGNLSTGYAHSTTSASAFQYPPNATTLMGSTLSLASSSIDQPQQPSNLAYNHSSQSQATPTARTLNISSGVSISNSYIGARSPVVCRSAASLSKGAELKRARSQDKGDMNSCSISTHSSAENIANESVGSLIFMDSYTNKTDTYPQSSLWVGTSFGSVLAIRIALPERRSTQPVVTSLTGILLRLRGEVHCVAFLDQTGNLLNTPSERWEETPSVANAPPGTRTSQILTDENISSSTTNTSSATDANAPSSFSGSGNRIGRQMTFAETRTSSSSCADSGNTSPLANVVSVRQYCIICSEKQIRVFALPSQQCIFKVKVTETSQVMKASVVRLKNQPFLAAYLANGHIVCYSLPSLRLLLDAGECLPPMIAGDSKFRRCFAFANNALGIYCISPTELEKITLSDEMCCNLKEMQGELYTNCPMPDSPKKNFIQNIFSNPAIVLDREALFGEAQSGRASSTLASVSSNTKMSAAQNAATSSQSEVAKARQAFVERGLKLENTVQQTQEMADQSKSFARTTALIAKKYEKKDRGFWPF